MNWTPEYFVRLVALPCSVHGVTLPNNDGTFDVYINSQLPLDQQQDCLQHEIWHIMHDHFYQERPVSDCEAEADARRAG